LEKLVRFKATLEKEFKRTFTNEEVLDAWRRLATVYRLASEWRPPTEPSTS
jgi:hypothetical protein